MAAAVLQHGHSSVEVVPHENHQGVVEDTGRGWIGRVVRRGMSHGDVLRVVAVGEAHERGRARGEVGIAPASGGRIRGGAASKLSKEGGVIRSGGDPLCRVGEESRGKRSGHGGAIGKAVMPR